MELWAKVRQHKSEEPTHANLIDFANTTIMPSDNGNIGYKKTFTQWCRLVLSLLTSNKLQWTVLVKSTFLHWHYYQQIPAIQKSVIKWHVPAMMALVLSLEFQGVFPTTTNINALKLKLSHFTHDKVSKVLAQIVCY